MPITQLPLQGTILTITPTDPQTAFQLPQWSARGLTQTLDPIDDSGVGTTIRRTINGKLIDLTNPIFQLYKTTITCTDIRTPCLDGAWRGQIVRIDCALELGFFTTGGVAARPIVGNVLPRNEGAWSWYRPSLTMMITSITQGYEEWPALYQWKLEAEEVGGT
jgi:hypothetical protein